MAFLLSILAAYILADAFSGLYHWATDYGFNVQSQIKLFQNHHETNTLEDFDWQTFAGGMPLVALGGWLHSPFLLALGVFVALTQVTHYYAHRRSESELVHHIVRVLQITHIIVHPASHQNHHGGQFNRDFCLLNGWNNWWLNGLVELFDAPSEGR